MNNDSFFSLDRLMEFGLTAAFAQQMVNTFNESMKSMYVPGSLASIPRPQVVPQTFYVALDGVATGPIDEAELARLAMEGRINSQSLVWMQGMAAWKPAGEVAEVLRVIASTPPPLPQQD